MSRPNSSGRLTSNWTTWNPNWWRTCPTRFERSSPTSRTTRRTRLCSITRSCMQWSSPRCGPRLAYSAAARSCSRPSWLWTSLSSPSRTCLNWSCCWSRSPRTGGCSRPWTKWWSGWCSWSSCRCFWWTTSRPCWAGRTTASGSSTWCCWPRWASSRSSTPTRPWTRSKSSWTCSCSWTRGTRRPARTLTSSSSCSSWSRSACRASWSGRPSWCRSERAWAHSSSWLASCRCATWWTPSSSRTNPACVHSRNSRKAAALDTKTWSTTDSTGRATKTPSSTTCASCTSSSRSSLTSSGSMHTKWNSCKPMGTHTSSTMATSTPSAACSHWPNSKTLPKKKNWKSLTTGNLRIL